MSSGCANKSNYETRLCWRCNELQAEVERLQRDIKVSDDAMKDITKSYLNRNAEVEMWEQRWSRLKEYIVNAGPYPEKAMKNLEAEGKEEE
jgi:hypothetical protein